MGALESQDRKQSFVSFRVSEVAFEAIALAARASGSSISELAREATLAAARQRLHDAGALGSDK